MDNYEERRTLQKKMLGDDNRRTVILRNESMRVPYRGHRPIPRRL